MVVIDPPTFNQEDILNGKLTEITFNVTNLGLIAALNFRMQQVEHPIITFIAQYDDTTPFDIPAKTSVYLTYKIEVNTTILEEAAEAAEDGIVEKRSLRQG